MIPHWVSQNVGMLTEVAINLAVSRDSYSEKGKVEMWHNISTFCNFTEVL